MTEPSWTLIHDGEAWMLESVDGTHRLPFRNTEIPPDQREEAWAWALDELDARDRKERNEPPGDHG